jgi:hypothetical protein
MVDAIRDDVGASQEMEDSEGGYGGGGGKYSTSLRASFLSKMPICV